MAFPCKNVGTVDRIIRAAVGIVSLVLAFTRLDVMHANPLGIVSAVVGIVMLLTAMLAMCPLYIPLKLTTCKPPPRTKNL